MSGTAGELAEPHRPQLSCAMSAVLVARVRAHGGDAAVGELLRRAAPNRSLETLLDSGSWLSYDEALRLWSAGATITHDPLFAFGVGREMAQHLTASPVAALVRSLRGPEEVYRTLPVLAPRFSTVQRFEVAACGPGRAELSAQVTDGARPSLDLCAWTSGLISAAPVLFGLRAAHVRHNECQALGAARCVYRISWSEVADAVEPGDGGLGRDEAMRRQLEAMNERLRSVYEVAAELIATDDIDSILARIVHRAAVEVRAPRYLLSLRLPYTDRVVRLHRGLDADAADRYAAMLAGGAAELPDSWLVVPVRSSRHDYGSLLAVQEPGQTFLPQERELLGVYARLAAGALDNATALLVARRLQRRSRALLELARLLAEAGTSEEIVLRLVDAVRLVVDCDRVRVFLWDGTRRRLVQRAYGGAADVQGGDQDLAITAALEGDGLLAQLLERSRTEAIFLNGSTEHRHMRDYLRTSTSSAIVFMPLFSPEAFLGLLGVGVAERPERLDPTPDLLDRLSGVAAQASTALQNGRLVDTFARHALQDSLTGLANRLQFGESLRRAVDRARANEGSVALLFIDLDGFKPINDRFGHDVGDALLVAVGERLLACTRAGDTVGRLGGDEFAVLIENPLRVDQLAERLRGAFAEPFEAAGRSLRVGASIGSACFPRDAGSAEDLLRAADSAMYAVKRSGRGGR